MGNSAHRRNLKGQMAYTRQIPVRKSYKAELEVQGLSAVAGTFQSPLASRRSVMASATSCS